MYASLSRHDARLAQRAGEIHQSKVGPSVKIEAAESGSSPSIEVDRIPTPPKHQRFVFTDPVVFRYMRPFLSNVAYLVLMLLLDISKKTRRPMC